MKPSVCYILPVCALVLISEVNCNWIFPGRASVSGPQVESDNTRFRPGVPPFSRPQFENEDDPLDYEQQPERPRPGTPENSTQPPQPGQNPSRQEVDFTVGSNDSINIPAVINFAPCQCPFSSQYSPVCGSDRRSYYNRMVMNCHRRCGTNVQLAKIGAC